MPTGAERSAEIRNCLVCVNLDCKSRGSRDRMEEIKTALAEAGSTVVVKEYLCFGNCDDGPNMVLYPNGTGYSNVQKEDIPEIVTHIEGGEPVTRLTKRWNPDYLNIALEILDSGIEIS